MQGDTPAFPSHGTMGEVNHQGMTLRQWYAGMAMQGMLAHSCDRAANLINEKAEAVAERAFEMADALLAAQGDGNE